MNRPEPYPAEPLLLVDDEPSWLHSLGLNLEYFGNFNQILTCQDSRDVIGLLRWQKVSLVLLDLMMPHLSGEDLLLQLGQEHPDVPVIVLSGLNQLETAVRCMKLGAFDYYVKTSEPDRLIAGIQRALQMSALYRENRELTNRLLHQELRHPELFAPVVTRSPRMEGIFRYLEAIAGSPNPVLLRGELGTGKRLLANTLCALIDPALPIVTLSAQALQGEDGADLLFGRNERPGAMQEAQGGVLLLTDLQELPIPLQGRLARILVQGELAEAGAAPQRLQGRILSTATPQLTELVESGRFRKDLFHRLGTHLIDLPPLRERFEDLPMLVEHILGGIATTTRPIRLPRHLMPLLSTYAFPGNIEELRQLLTTVVEETPARRLSIDRFRFHLEARQRAAGSSGAGTEQPVPAELLFPGRFPSLVEARELTVREAMRRAHGNQTIAARLLGISQPALSIHLKKATSSAPDELPPS